MKVLLHTCCAPCSLSCIAPLQNEGLEVDLFWYNPNIHPYTEYKSRRDCLLNYAEEIGLKVTNKNIVLPCGNTTVWTGSDVIG